MLCLQTEEEAGREALDVLHTVHVVLGQRGAEVPVAQGHQVPHTRKQQPRREEGRGEGEQRPRPVKVDHRGEEVLQESEPFLQS